MNDKRIEVLKALEKDIKTELTNQANAEWAAGLHKNSPITDGVVDETLYLASSPKMLWILKEPWEEGIDETGGGGWSVTKCLIPKRIREQSIGNRGTYANMAWVTFSVLNGYQSWQELPWVSGDPRVGESLKNIAYINISKFPGKKTSHRPFLKKCYARNRGLLLRQIAAIDPDVVIGGSTLPLFFTDLELAPSDFTSTASVKVCNKGKRLYIDAMHPGGRFGSEWYVNDIVTVIKQYRQKWDHVRETSKQTSFRAF